MLWIVDSEMQVVYTWVDDAIKICPADHLCSDFSTAYVAKAIIVSCIDKGFFCDVLVKDALSFYTTKNMWSSVSQTTSGFSDQVTMHFDGCLHLYWALPTSDPNARDVF